MKKIIFLLVVLFAVASIATAEEVKRVYKPSRSTVISEYHVKTVPTLGGGTGQNVYRTGEIVPRYIVRDGKVYSPQRSLVVPQKKYLDRR